MRSAQGGELGAASNPSSHRPHPKIKYKPKRMEEGVFSEPLCHATDRTSRVGESQQRGLHCRGEH